MNASELPASAPVVLFAAVSAFAARRISRTGRGRRDDPQRRLPADAGWDGLFDAPGIDIRREQSPAQQRETS